MKAGAFYALLPPGLALLTRWLGGALGLELEGLADPLAAFARSLPALVIFWGWPAEAFREGLVLPLYGAYAGAVLDERGYLGALGGLLLALGLRPLLRLPARYRFPAAVLYVAVATGLTTAALLLTGHSSGWLLPLVLLLVGLLDPSFTDLRHR